MELSFASAGWLAGLSALAVPVLLHWLASQQQPPSRFAPMRFLQNLAAEQRGRRLSELWLLLARLLLLALMVLALAGPHLQTTVTRSRDVTVLHPTVATDTDASDHFRLCAGAQLLPAGQICPALTTTKSASTADAFLTDLLQVLDQQPEWRTVAVRVPASLPLPPLTLPTVPVAVTWQIEPSASVSATEQAATLPWQVFASDQDWRFFAAGNAITGTPRWQRAEQMDDADVVIANQSESVPSARVWWHDQTVAWQHVEARPAGWDYYLSGAQLQLRWSGTDAERAATLLSQTDDWLQRGQWQPRINPVTLRFGDAGALTAIQRTDLTPWLMLAALLCWLLERRLAHGRR